MAGTNQPRTSGGDSAAWRGIAIGAVIVATCAVIIGVVAVVAWRNADTAPEGDESPGMLEAAFEPADSIGPNAFTPPVTTETPQICDKELFLEYLDERPDAQREWARVLNVDEDDLEEYVMSLEPIVLDDDTLVTNHGLADGKAYARLSLLEEGTAVLVEPPPEVTETPEESSTTSTAPPEEPRVVTRCKCGNPLLPPPDTTTTSSSTTSSTTTLEEPEDDGNPPSDQPPSDEPSGEPPPEEVPPDEETPPEEVPPDEEQPPDDQGTPSPDQT